MYTHIGKLVLVACASDMDMAASKYGIGNPLTFLTPALMAMDSLIPIPMFPRPNPSFMLEAIDMDSLMDMPNPPSPNPI